jgi:hypothetical protein
MARLVKAGHSQGHERAQESRTDLRFYRGAGDGNRTRTISLGTRQIGVSHYPDLGTRCTTSDRHRP